MSEYKPRINLRKSVGLIVVTIIVMAVAVWLLAHENFYNMLGAVRSADRLFVLLAIVIYFISVAIWAIRWQTALSFIQCRISFLTRYMILCATIFLNNITPVARVGGDPFGRIYMMRKLANTSYSSAIASIIGEHAFIPLIIVSFLMAGLMFGFGQRSLQLTLILTAIWVLAALGAVFGPRFFFRKRIAIKGVSGITRRVLGWFGNRSNFREIVGAIEAFYSSAYATMDKWQNVLAIGTLTLLIGALDMLRLYTIFLALGYHPSLSMLLVASSLPVFISVFALFGVPLELAMAATVIERGISFVLSTMVGAGVFSYLGVRMAARPEGQR